MDPNIAVAARFTARRALPVGERSPRTVTLGHLDDGTEAVLKTSPDTLTVEADLLGSYAAAGIDTVEVLGCSDEPSPWLLTRYVAGHWPLENAHQLVGRVTRIAAAIRTVEAHPTGHRDIAPIIVEDARWAGERLRPAGLGPQTIELLTDHLARLPGYHTVHGDLLPKNLIDVDGVLTVIDPQPRCGPATTDVAHWIGKACRHRDTTTDLIDEAVRTDPTLDRASLMLQTAAYRLWTVAALDHPDTWPGQAHHITHLIRAAT